MRLWQQDDQILRDETYCFLLHRLWNPDTGILRHTELAADDADIRTVQVTSPAYCIGISCSDRHFRQVRGDLLGVRIDLLDQLVDVLAFFYFDHMTTNTLRHFDELHQWVGIGYCLDIAQVGHVKFFSDVCPISLQNVFFITHFSNSLMILWKGFFGNSIILWPSAQGFKPQFMMGEGMILAQCAKAVPRL